VKGKLVPDNYQPVVRQYRTSGLVPKPVKKKQFYQVAISVIIFLVVIASFQTDYTVSRTVQKQAKYQLTHNTDLSPGLYSLRRFLTWAAALESSPGQAEVAMSPSIWSGFPISGRVVRGFGPYFSQPGGSKQFHNGIDIAARQGTPIRAYGGEVVSIKNGGDAGQVLEIKDSAGITTVYGYCREVKVKEGERVTKGQVVASLGGGNAEAGSTLHFEIRGNGKPVDPFVYLDGTGERQPSSYPVTTTN